MRRGPVEYTCPLIDKCIRYIEDALGDPEQLSYLESLISRTGELETIRNHNESLRGWGAEQEDRVEELESEVESLQEKLDAALADVASLRAELGELEGI